jgi:hypothetical protein
MTNHLEQLEKEILQIIALHGSEKINEMHKFHMVMRHYNIDVFPLLEKCGFTLDYSSDDVNSLVQALTGVLEKIRNGRKNQITI